MFNHAPDNYVCPICVGVDGVEDERTLIRKLDAVYRDDLVMVFVASYFIETCQGHLIVVPLEHYEHLYDMPDEVGARVFSVARKLSVTMKKAYGCEGVTTLQNNEPAGGQHAFHYHLHLFPRCEGDRLHENMGKKREASLKERLRFGEKIRGVLEK